MGGLEMAPHPPMLGAPRRSRDAPRRSLLAGRGSRGLFADAAGDQLRALLAVGDPNVLTRSEGVEQGGVLHLERVLLLVLVCGQRERLGGLVDRRDVARLV